MFCLKCGEAIPDGSLVCPKCGADPAQESGEKGTPETAEKVERPSRISKGAKAGIAAAVVIALAVLLIHGVGTAMLRKQIQKEWKAVDGSVLKILEFSEDEVEYRAETEISWIRATIGTYDYKVVGPHKIKVEWTEDHYTTFTIEFNDEKEIMTITPAFTDPDAEFEKWYDFEGY